jgi:hypothetical protein
MTERTRDGSGDVRIRALTRVLFRLFYARVEAVGAENVSA